MPVTPKSVPHYECSFFCWVPKCECVIVSLLYLYHRQYANLLCV